MKYFHYWEDLCKWHESSVYISVIRYWRSFVEIGIVERVFSLTIKTISVTADIYFLAISQEIYADLNVFENNLLPCKWESIDIG